MHIGRMRIKELYAKNNVIYFGISVSTLLTFLLLYFFRNLDDNRLTSWESAFLWVDASRIFLLITSGVIFAFLIRHISVPKHMRILFLCTLSAMSSAILWREPEVIIDASRYFTQAKHLELYGFGYFFSQWGREISAWTDMPLVPLLDGLIFRFIGESRLYIQVFNTLLFSMSALLTYLIGKELWDEETGYMGGLLLLGIPYLLTQVPLMLVDVQSIFFLLSAVYFVVLALKRGGVMIVSAALGMTLSFYCKYSSWLMLTVIPVIFAVFLFLTYGKEDMRKQIMRFFLVVCIAAVTIVIIYLTKADVFAAQMKLLAEYQKPGLSRWGESFVSTFLFQVHPFISVAALSSIFLAIKRRDAKYAIVFWLVFVVTVMQIRRIRYIIMVFPMLCLMASYGLSWVDDRWIRKNIISNVLVFSLITAFFVYGPFLEKMSAVNIRDAGRFLDSGSWSFAKVYTYMPVAQVANPASVVPLLDLFTKKKIIYGNDISLATVPKEDRDTSSLRFTWEYRNPSYYEETNEKAKDYAVVVISENAEEPLPEAIEENIRGCGLRKVFNSYENVFLFRTSARIFDCRNGNIGESIGMGIEDKAQYSPSKVKIRG